MGNGHSAPKVMAQDQAILKCVQISNNSLTLLLIHHMISLKNQLDKLRKYQKQVGPIHCQMRCDSWVHKHLTMV